MKKLAFAVLVSISLAFVGYAGFYVYVVYLYKPDTLTQAYLDERDPKKKLVLLEGIMGPDGYDRWVWLDNAAALAYESSDYEKSGRYALESLSGSAAYPSDWNYGNSIHNSNLVLGRLALLEGDVERAKKHLDQAGKTSGSPQLDTFGPDMKLAEELMRLGEASAVLAYLSSVKRFWEMDNGCVDRWIKQIMANETPELCKCSCR